MSIPSEGPFGNLIKVIKTFDELVNQSVNHLLLEMIYQFVGFLDCFSIFW